MNEARFEACARAFDRIEMRVSGECMRPVLVPGAKVGLEHTRLRPPRLGDIVLVRTQRGLRLHRVVWKSPFGGTLRTKGDRATAWDPKVSPSDVISTVVSADMTADPTRGRLWRTVRSLAVLVLARVRRTVTRGGR